jgi:gluconate 5-dehydrogenase
MTLDLFNLAGKCALVTGSSQGIGLALAEGLALAGAQVILNGRNIEKLKSAKALLERKGIKTAAANFDVTNEDEVETAVGCIEREQGPIDILVNNAGMQFRAPLEDFPLDKWRELMRVNVESAFIVGKAVAKGMIARKQGKIINISSVQSELGRPTIAPYTATKGAIKMLTKGMCADWARLLQDAAQPGAGGQSGIFSLA